MNKITTSIGRYLAAPIVAVALLATGATQIAPLSTNPETTQSITLAANSVPLQTTQHLYPSCLFGKAHKHRKGCRGGNLVKKAKPAMKECIKNGKTGADIGGVFGFPGTVAGAAAGCAYKDNKKDDNRVRQSPGWKDEPTVTHEAESPHRGSSAREAEVNEPAVIQGK